MKILNRNIKLIKPLNNDLNEKKSPSDYENIL